MEQQIKLIAGKVKIPVTMIDTGNRLEFKFSYNPKLMDEIKAMRGSRYHGYDKVNPRKTWSVDKHDRNLFQLRYLQGDDVYARWDRPLVQPNNSRPVYEHQNTLISSGLTYHYVIWAAEMGTGKTLAAIETMEQSCRSDWLWVGPKQTLHAIKLELRKWKSRVEPIIISYEQLIKLMEGWGNALPPHGVIFDESSRLKNSMTQRSQAAQYLADLIRKSWGDEGFVIEMSGSPAPKAPSDWWSQCEIAWPGFIREGRPDRFKARLALIKQVEAFQGGGSFPKLVTWFDDENKCQFCGLQKQDSMHDLANMAVEGFHNFQPSVNEVAYLYERMKGLVWVLMKKDCLDLPDKQYRTIFCRPTTEIMNVMKTIIATSGTGARALTLLRELSDGFQYKETESGIQCCTGCLGSKKVIAKSYIGPELTDAELDAAGVSSSACHPDSINHPDWWKDEEIDCPNCKGTGQEPTYTRIADQVTCPKEQVLRDILDEHDDVGRIVIYAGFTGSVDRCVEICKKEGWNVVRVDGRGWDSDLARGGKPILEPTEILEIFQSQDREIRDTFSRVAFVGQPGAAGMGLTLTASPTIFYYSNDFNAESRIQSEDRIHRPGMDVNRGATIIDCIHLPSDKLVLDNLRVKRDLQSMTLGEMQRAIARVKIDADRVV